MRPSAEHAEPAASNRQRFVEEPADTFALVGQAAATLGCRVADKRGPLYWYRDQLWLSNERQTFGHGARYSVEAPGATEPGAAEPASYALRIHNVSLLDDGHYLCAVAGADDAHQPIKSRRAKLTVLQPPGRLELVARHQQDGPTAPSQAQVSVVRAGQARRECLGVGARTLTNLAVSHHHHDLLVVAGTKPIWARRLANAATQLQSSRAIDTAAHWLVIIGACARAPIYHPIGAIK